MRHPGTRAAAGAAFAVAAAVLLGATGCGLTVFGAPVPCVDWVGFDTPQSAADDADAVVRGTAAGRDGTVRLFGVDAHAWTFEIDEVLSGEVGDAVVRVASTPETCTEGGAYPEGDPLDAASELLLLLDYDAEARVWRTITPYAGTVPPAPDGGLPTAWPPGHPSSLDGS